MCYAHHSAASLNRPSSSLPPGPDTFLDTLPTGLPCYSRLGPKIPLGTLAEPPPTPLNVEAVQALVYLPLI